MVVVQDQPIQDVLLQQPHVSTQFGNPAVPQARPQAPAAMAHVLAPKHVLLVHQIVALV